MWSGILLWFWFVFPWCRVMWSSFSWFVSFNNLIFFCFKYPWIIFVCCSPPNTFFLLFQRISPPTDRLAHMGSHSYRLYLCPLIFSFSLSRPSFSPVFSFLPFMLWLSHQTPGFLVPSSFLSPPPKLSQHTAHLKTFVKWYCSSFLQMLDSVFCSKGKRPDFQPWRLSRAV